MFLYFRLSAKLIHIWLLWLWSQVRYLWQCPPNKIPLNKQIRYRGDNGFKHSEKKIAISLYKRFLKHLLFTTEKRINCSPDFYLGICINIQLGYARHLNSFPHTFSSLGTWWYWRVYYLLSLGSRVIWWECIPEHWGIKVKNPSFARVLSFLSSPFNSSHFKWILLRNMRSRGKVFPEDTPWRPCLC